ncbi:hypothetical protein SO802_010851 [Lithocarpus litseifolius]|uniref:RNase H type-1 domain-containing protein n=1 Tax=Lithocarpus litseifolius TaxID=425828 RepID=A0AAW2DGU4_9ROSI
MSALCGKTPETLEHLFLQCDWTAQVWLLSPWPLRLNTLDSISIVNWVKMIIDPKSFLALDDEATKEFQLFAVIMCDQVWMCRNKAQVDGIEITSVDLARQVYKSFKEHKQAWMMQCKNSSKDNTWIPPPPNWIKLNFDAAIREGKTSVAVVGRDQKGNLVATWVEQRCPGSPLSGEANAALLAIQRAVEAGFKNVVIEGDALNVIEPLRNQLIAPHWSIKFVVEDILYFAKGLDNVKFSFVCRVGNEAAHLLARWVAILNWNGPVPISNLSTLIIQALDRDGNKPNLDYMSLFCRK